MLKNNYYIYRFLKFIGKPIFKVLFRPKINSKYEIPYGEAIIFAGNHKSYMDPLLLIISTKDVVHFLAKKELFKGLLKKFFLSVGCIPVNRKTKDKNATEMAVNVLKNNAIIGIFPEGTRNRSGDILMPFKYGAVSMAQKTNAWVIPFGISGDYKLFKKGLSINLGKPYKVEKDLESENLILMQNVESLIKEEYEK